MKSKDEDIENISAIMDFMKSLNSLVVCAFYNYNSNFYRVGEFVVVLLMGKLF